MLLLSLLARILPRILVSIGNSEIGRYEGISCGSWPGFKSNEILALYRVGGRTENSLAWLYICNNKGNKFGVFFYFYSTLNPSGPEALLLGKEAITCMISSNLISLSSISTESDIHLGRFRYSKLSAVAWGSKSTCDR